MTEYNPTYDTSDVNSVRIEVLHTNVNIIGGADALRVETDPPDALREFFEVRQEGGTLYIKQPPFYFGIRERVTLSLRLPATATDVGCSTGHGDVNIRSLRAALNARTGHGDISIESGSGVLEAHTGKGDVSVTVWDGPARLATGSGDVNAEVVSGSLTVSTGRGDVGIVTCGGKVNASTGHGDVTVGKLAGEVTISTGHGDISATELEGARLNVNTGRGDVSVGGRLGGLNARSGAGDFDIRCSLLAGEFEANTNHGTMNIHLPADTSARFDISTRRGRIESNLPLVKVGLPGPDSHHSKRYVVNVGGERPQASVKLRTNHGDIHLFGSGEGEKVTYETAGEPSVAFDPAAMSVAGEAIASAVRTATTATERALEETFRQMRERFPESFAPQPPTPPAPPTPPSPPTPPASTVTPLTPTAERQDAPSDPRAAPAAEAPEAAPAQVAPTASSAPEAPAPEPAAPAAATQAADNRLKILEAVSAGKISIDEALVLLSRVESESRR